MDFRADRVTELADQVRRGERSAASLTEHSLGRIAALNPRVNAFVAVNEDRAHEQAARIDRLVAAGGDPGPLAGIPLGVKDLEDAAGLRTTYGSPLLEDAPLAREDSALVARLRRAGCVIIGKTNTPEFGWASTTANKIFGVTRNPWNLEHSAGGSSGGSAAALASGMVPLATGSDGGGSIRIPSAACGLSGFKPSLGRVPAGGAEAPDWLELSSKGPMARSIFDLAEVLDVVVGPEPSDLASLPRAEASWSSAVQDPQLPAKVGWAPTLGYAPVDYEVLQACEAALELLGTLGVEVVEVDGLFDHDPVDEWLTIVGACLARSLGPLKGHPHYGAVDETLQLLVDGGLALDAVGLVRAIDASHHLNLRLLEQLAQVQLLITPTTAGVAPPLSLEGIGLINGIEELNWVRFTYPFNMTRSPAATLSVGLASSGVPIGLQLIGPQLGDLAVLEAAAAFEQAFGFSTLAEI
jgi:Asp-tRNA(Asn)/Glu-tRNA(Gln) amidotransferase A subunit family amidase